MEVKPALQAIAPFKGADAEDERERRRTTCICDLLLWLKISSEVERESYLSPSQGKRSDRRRLLFPFASTSSRSTPAAAAAEPSRPRPGQVCSLEGLVTFKVADPGEGKEVETGTAPYRGASPIGARRGSK